MCVKLRAEADDTDCKGCLVLGKLCPFVSAVACFIVISWCSDRMIKFGHNEHMENAQTLLLLYA